MANQPGVVKTGGGGKSKVARESKWVRDAKRFQTINCFGDSGIDSKEACAGSSSV